jgi:hypothetical protein
MTHALTPGVTSIPRQLLKHWFDRGEWSSEEKRWIGEPRQYPFYFRQLEAIEALIWWQEAPPDFKQGIFKGVDNEQNRAKRAAMETWIKSVNEQDGFGHWCFAMVFTPDNIRDVMFNLSATSIAP